MGKITTALTIANTNQLKKLRKALTTPTSQSERNARFPVLFVSNFKVGSLFPAFFLVSVLPFTFLEALTFRYGY